MSRELLIGNIGPKQAAAPMLRVGVCMSGGGYARCTSTWCAALSDAPTGTAAIGRSHPAAVGRSHPAAPSVPALACTSAMLERRALRDRRLGLTSHRMTATHHVRLHCSSTRLERCGRPGGPSCITPHLSHAP